MGHTDLAVYDPEFAKAQQIAQAWDDLRSVWDELIAFVDSVWQAVKEIVHTAVSFICTAFEKIRACIVPGRVLYLSRHGKTHRVRKKNRKRIEKLWRRILS